jgi:hypothetical protein
MAKGKKTSGRRKRPVPLCRICKKRPVWRGGDVKDPGPHCKRCYHKHVWPQRPGARRAPPAAAGDLADSAEDG